ncbi:MAG: hypothetical protein HY866_02665 [Chloroflexi bacterium]|nr:hypothetical protein [Chloroflexota bacterium]
MSTRGMYDRDGELFGYIDGVRVYNRQGDLIGEMRGQAIYDLQEERRWLLDRDALLDLRGNVIGYLGARVPQDE